MNLPLICLMIVAAGTSQRVVRAQTEPQEAPLPARDLRVDKVPRRGVLMTVANTLRGNLVVEDGPTLRVDRRFRARLFDVHDKVTEGEVGSRRRYLQWEVTDDNAPNDPEIAGLEMTFSVRGSRFDSGLVAGLASKKTLAELDLHVRSLCGWLPLPHAAELGKAYEVNFEAMIPVMLELDAWPKSSTGKLVLKEVKVDKNLATLAGPLEVQVKTGGEGSGVFSTYEGVAEVVVDYGERQLLTISYEGTVTGIGKTSNRSFTLKAKFSSQVECASGKAAEQAANAKVVLRSVPRRLREEDLEFDLPSHWFDAGMNDKDHSFVTGADGGAREIQVRVVLSKDPKADIAVGEKLLLQSPSAKSTSLSTKLGSGRSIRTSKDDLTTIYDLVADKDRVVRIVLRCPKERLSAGIKDLGLVRRSLRRMR